MKHNNGCSFKGFIYFLLLLRFVWLLKSVPAISKQRQGSPGISSTQTEKAEPPSTLAPTHVLVLDGGRKPQDPETTHADAQHGLHTNSTLFFLNDGQSTLFFSLPHHDKDLNGHFSHATKMLFIQPLFMCHHKKSSRYSRQICSDPNKFLFKERQVGKLRLSLRDSIRIGKATK